MELNKDNQQERLLGWFSGIIEGEGTISIQKVNGKRLVLTPYICIVNTDVRLINRCIELLNIYDIKSHTYLRDSGVNKPVYQIRIDGMKAVAKLLELVKPILVGKQDQAQLVLDYIKQRQAKYFKQDSQGRLRRRPYDLIDFGFYEEIKRLHHTVSPETIRRDIGQPIKDIVRAMQ